MENWFKDWFSSDLYLAVYNHRDESDARKLCNLILETTNIKPGSKILDGACGAGRHANYFSSLGFDVTGFDLSKTLLKLASNQLLGKKLSTKFVCADIRNIFFKTKFNLVANLFTSFGYFIDDEQNFSFITNVHKMLYDGGFYILDYLNPIYLNLNLVKESSRIIDDVTITEQRRIENNRVEKEIVITKNGTEKRFRESVSLYSKDVLSSKIQEIGFTLTNIFGDYNGSQFHEEKSPRMIMVFRK
jgi:SAM-dependent methyltransferase